MDALFAILLVAGSIIFRMQKHAKRQKQTEQAEGRSRTPGSAAQEEPWRPGRSAAAHPPERKGPSIHWEGTVDEPDSDEGESYEDQSYWSRTPPIAPDNMTAQPTIIKSRMTSAQPTIMQSRMTSAQPTIMQSTMTSAQPTIMQSTMTSAQPTIMQSSMTSAQPTITMSREQEVRPVAIPGLDLLMDGDSLVKGMIFAEVLGKRSGGRRN